MISIVSPPTAGGMEWLRRRQMGKGLSMKRFACVPILLVMFSAKTNAADEPLPRLRGDPSMQASIEGCLRVQALRDTRDTTLVEVMIQSDHPPTPMAFEVSLRAGGKTYPVGPMVWNGEMQWWAYDVDLPADIGNVEAVFTADPKALRRLQRISALAPHDMVAIWDGTAVVKDVKIQKQTLGGMIARLPPQAQVLSEIYADEMEGASEVVSRFRQDRDVPAARAALERMREQHPKDAVVLYNLGCLDAAEGKWLDAVERFAQAKSAAGADSFADRAQHQIRQIGGYVADGARRDDPASMLALAIMYDRAWGPARDLQNAKRLYRNAANAGIAAAMTRLGALYAEDLKIATDAKAQAWYREEMMSMYRQAAQLDDKEAKAWLAQHEGR
jgi:hypothetical protein